MKTIQSGLPLLLLLWTGSIHAQAYFTAGGIRMGPSWGITVQQRILERVTGEFVLSQSLANKESSIYLMGKLHNSLVTKHANLFVGGGIHRSWNRAATEEKKRMDGGGMAAVVGAELTIGKVNISWDYRPRLDLTSGATRFFSAESALYIRYILIKKLSKKKSKNRPSRQDTRPSKKRKRRN
ncbi:MAG: hypothetical protein KTR24_14345 [Saprospiraceae bacterium]|nr:hypothetical protein [Saprospiraceae bacterium]